ncbi:MAG: single-stranded DNA-binding protein [bacterium]|nr:single-stranded DNA-binding protein [bacterium]
MARSLNKVMLIGNLGRDPELKATASGTQVTTFTLATNRRYKDKSGEFQEETQWHNIVAWGNQAEFIASYMKKGSRVYVEGRLTHRSWDDKDGQKHYMTEVVLEHFVPLDAPPEGARTGARREPVPPPPEPPEAIGSADGEDVPF